MQIPKLLAALSLASICALNLHAQNVDNPDQAKARDALRQAMGGTTAQPPVTNVAPVVKAPPVAANTNADWNVLPAQTTPPLVREVAKPQPPVTVVTTPAPKPTPVPAPTPAPVVVTTPAPKPAPISAPQVAMPASAQSNSLSPEEIEKARAAMRKTMQDLDAKEKPAMATTPPSKPVVEPRKVEAKPAKPVAVTTTTPTVPPAKVETKPTARPGSTGTQAPMTTMPEVAPAVPPPIPTAGSKEERLSELLQQYRQDLITPDEYQARRAKIRAEPDK